MQLTQLALSSRCVVGQLTETPYGTNVDKRDLDHMHAKRKGPKEVGNRRYCFLGQSHESCSIPKHMN